MHRQHRRWFLAALATSLLAVALPTGPAGAQSLDALRGSGVVGERFDGLLVVRDASASSAVRSLVSQTNAQRRQIYARRAAEQGVPADQVGRVYAMEIFQKAPRGTWFLGEDGRWVRK